MESDVGVVLMHGAGLGNFIWDDVVSRVARPTLPVEFPNRGQGSATARLTLQDYVDTVAERVEGWSHCRVVLVAHSIGGTVALDVADRLPDRVAGILGIGAAFPRRGESFVSCLPFPQKLIMPGLLRVFGTRPPTKAIEQGLCADLPPELSRKVVERFTPESRSLYTGKVQYRSLPAERWYVKLTKDRDFPLPVQEVMIENLEATRVVELESGHLPMMSRPDEVAEIVSDFADHLRD